MIIDTSRMGFTYLIETVRNGQVIASDKVCNIIPLQGIHHMLNVLLFMEAQVATWYIGLYETDYAPQPTDTMATFIPLVTESTAYTAASRIALVPGTPVAGVTSNQDNRAEFEFTGDRTVRGGFIASTSPKGSTAGILLSAVRFSSPRVVDTGAILRVTAGLQITS